MLAKPFIFLLTFMLTIANFMFLLLPVSIIIFPLYIFFYDFFANTWNDLFFLFVAIISVFTLVYMFFDMLFGFTSRFLNKKARPIEIMTAVPRQREIMESFEWLKRRFNLENAQLFIDPDGDIINAYAIGSSNKQIVTLTLGLIFEIHRTYDYEEDYVAAIQGIMGHELSHLANKDFLPGLLTASSYKVNHQAAKLVRLALMVLANVLLFIPVIGWYVKFFIYRVYSLVLSFSGLFLRFIYMPLHRFFMKFFGRSIEYRCDRESAYTVGGQSMVLGLRALGKGSYFSIFSTHPRTKSRINKVAKVNPITGEIKPSIFNTIANTISILMIVMVMYFATFSVDWNNLEANYLAGVHQPVKSFYIDTKIRISNVYHFIISKI
jgi:Zn-dependent protease with chaperone function